MKKFLKALDTLFPILLWSVLLLAISEGKTIYSILIMLMIINETIDRKGNSNE